MYDKSLNTLNRLYYDVLKQTRCGKPVIYKNRLYVPSDDMCIRSTSATTFEKVNYELPE